MRTGAVVLVAVVVWYSSQNTHPQKPLAENPLSQVSESTEQKNPKSTFNRSDFRCDFDVRDMTTMTDEEFRQEYYLPFKPVLIHAPHFNKRARDKWTRKWLLENHGDDLAEIGDPYRMGAWGQKEKKKPLQDFLNNIDDYTSRDKYMWSKTIMRKKARVGEPTTMQNDWKKWGVIKVLEEEGERENRKRQKIGIQGYKSKQLSFNLDLPKVRGDPKYTAMVIGGNGSGVGFHMHKDSFNEVLQGTKRWWLYPNTTYAPGYLFTPGHKQWLSEIEPKLQENERPSYCEQPPGTIMFIPEMWSHATMNKGETICVVSNPGGPRSGGYLDKLRLGESTLRALQQGPKHKTDFDKAFQLLEEAIEITPDHPEALTSATVQLANLKGTSDPSFQKYSALAMKNHCGKFPLLEEKCTREMQKGGMQRIMDFRP